MPDLSFAVESAEAVPFAAAPQISLRLRIINADAKEHIHSVALRVQIQIDAAHRRYNSEEKERLLDLFGEPDRWRRTLRSMLWLHAGIMVPPFTSTTTADLHLPCTFDFNVAATKYFYGVTEGDIPLTLLFSGSVFYADAEGQLQVAPISWDKEARVRVPVGTWRTMMDEYYPNSAWLSLHREVFEHFRAYKSRHGIATWDEALERLLESALESKPDPLPEAVTP